MQIKALSLGLLGVNCYLISTNQAAIVIDPGNLDKRIEDFLIENKCKEKLILLTHCHFDHIGGANALREKYNTKIAIGENEASSLLDTNMTLSSRFRAHIEPFSADILLKDGELFKFADLEILCVETKGHTKGGMCYKIGDALFSGDTLFKQSVGRVDFPGGNSKELMVSLSKITQMFEDIDVYPGHGEATTLNSERKSNPFLRPDGEFLL